MADYSFNNDASQDDRKEVLENGSTCRIFGPKHPA